MLKTLYFAFFLGMTGVFVTVVAYLGFTLTDPYIQENRITAINNNIAILYNPDDGYHRNEFQADNAYQEKNYKLINAVYEVLDEDEEIFAVIYNVSAQGRNGIISALIAVNPYTDTVEAVTYYDHSETPNIGEKYTRDDAIISLIGQSISDVEVDAIANATVTWTAISSMFDEVEIHYVQEEVHLND